mmetsp:Transcript_9272/g.18904  ORF Transcript_9272/g.18904 Transcript_9272/m.18904 type:complete len:94 (-) Transcript_9272:1137-1418(-)
MINLERLTNAHRQTGLKLLQEENARLQSKIVELIQEIETRLGLQPTGSIEDGLLRIQELLRSDLGRLLASEMKRVKVKDPVRSDIIHETSSHS